MTRGFSIVVTRARGGESSRDDEHRHATNRKRAILADCAHDSCAGMDRLYQDSCNAATRLCCACMIGDTLLDVGYAVCCSVCCAVATRFIVRFVVRFAVREPLYSSLSPRLLIYDHASPALYRPDVRYQPRWC